MNARLLFLAPPCWWVGLALALGVAPSQAEPIRVTTWNLQPGVIAGTNASSTNFQHGLVQDAAERLKPLRPDIILLQQVADWETCRQLAQALQPENYQVAICSSFRDPRGKLLRRQAAVLSKAKAFLAWAEPWKKSSALPALPGGFAFAAIQVGNSNVGIFSVQFSDGDASGADESRSAQWQEARAESARQLVQQISLLQSWRNNRLQSFIVAGDFNTTPDDSRLAHEKTLSLLEQAGFDNAFAGLPLEKRATLPGDARRLAATLDYIFTRDAGVVGPALTAASPLWEHASVTCEMDLAARKPAPPPPLQIASKASPTPPPAAAPKSAPAPTILAASNTPSAPPPLAVSNALATSPSAAVSNAVAKTSPSHASNSAAASSPLVTSNTSTAPPKLAARAELPPVKNTSNPTNLAHAPVTPAGATTTSASPQALLWLGGFLAAGLALFFLARKLVQHAAPEAFPAATPDPKSRTGSSIT
ncbi:MAG TPA: endonuclease/exonuclease/phosphatase family protein, partial [Candidatus Cybelea sp.]|nr:endonuclease/exonuclease/phosphatase family protein [Candidatus Cybelea sp.]